MHYITTSTQRFVVFSSAPQLCGSEEFWEQAVRQRCNTVSADVAALALKLGWRSIFFTHKLQLQKLISRRKQKSDESVLSLGTDSSSHCDARTPQNPEQESVSTS